MKVLNSTIHEDHALYSRYHRVAENRQWWRRFAAALQASDYGSLFCCFLAEFNTLFRLKNKSKFIRTVGIQACVCLCNQFSLLSEVTC